MCGDKMQQNDRVPFFDNAKALLMALVVLGHFAECGIEESRALKTLFIFIYAFHMPAFFFVSGIFVRLKSLSARLAIQKTISFVAIGFMLKLALFALGCLLNQVPSSFSLLSDSNIPWFMFSLAAFQLLAWLFKASNPITILVCSICLSLFVGYDQSVGDYLYLSRTIVFFPFFWVGTMFSPVGFEKLARSKIPKWGGVLVILAFATFCIFALGDVYDYRGLFTGRNPYAQVGIDQCGWINRLIAYIISACVGFAFLCLTPKRELRLLTRMGQSTIQMYFWHVPILDLILASGTFSMLIGASIPAWWLAWLALGLLVAAISSSKLFRLPLQPLLDLAREKS